MYSAILLGYKLDTLMDYKTYHELIMRGFNVVEHIVDFAVGKAVGFELALVADGNVNAQRHDSNGGHVRE